jgi:branched-chain amino acid transport system permease protein
VPTYATDVATSHGLSTAVASNIPVAAYGVILILVMLLFPQGIAGAVRWFLGLFGLSSAPTWRRAPAPDAARPAALLAEPPETREKEGTQ